MKTNYEVAREVLAGKYGNGEERKRRLWEDGYDPSAVQSIVNALVADRDVPKHDQSRYMEVEVDLSLYDGLNLKFTGGIVK